MAFGVEQFGEHLPLGHAVGPILEALAALVLHDVALLIEPRLAHRVDEEAHAI